MLVTFEIDGTSFIPMLQQEFKTWGGGELVWNGVFAALVQT